MTPRERAELICDYFAACLLMPKRLLVRVWTTGGSRLPRTDLARLFGVSPQALDIRLKALGLVENHERCSARASQQLSWRELTKTYHRGLPTGLTDTEREQLARQLWHAFDLDAAPDLQVGSSSRTLGVHDLIGV